MEIKNITVTYKNNMKRNVTLYIDENEKSTPAETAQFYKDNYTLPFVKYMRKDAHKYEANFKIKDDLIGFSYIVAKDASTGSVIGFCACDVFNKKVKGQTIVASGTHCLCSLPPYDNETIGGRGCHLANELIKYLYEYAVNRYNINCDYEICNEISNKAYISQGWIETGKYRVNKNGERCMIRSELWFSEMM